MFRFVCLSLFLSSSTSLHKPASQWDSRLGSLTSRSSWFSSWTQSQLLFRLKIWTMRNVKLTACSNNFSLSTSLRNLKLESSHHQSASLHHLDSCSYFLPQSWVSSLYECLRTIPHTHTIHLYNYTANVNPRMYENTTLFFGDIVGFTKLTAQRWKRFKCWDVDHFHMLLQHCHPNNPILERSLQQVWQSHWQLWCLQGMTRNRKWPQIVSFNGQKDIVL